MRRKIQIRKPDQEQIAVDSGVIQRTHTSPTTVRCAVRELPAAKRAILAGHTRIASWPLAPRTRWEAVRVHRCGFYWASGVVPGLWLPTRDPWVRFPARPSPDLSPTD